jgi:hypothetical protein
MRNKRERPTARSYQILSNLFLSSFSCVCFNSSVFRVRGQPAIETGYYTHIEPEKKIEEFKLLTAIIAAAQIPWPEK